MDPKVKAVVIADRNVRKLESALDKAARGATLVRASLKIAVAGDSVVAGVDEYIAELVAQLAIARGILATASFAIAA